MLSLVRAGTIFGLLPGLGTPNVNDTLLCKDDPGTGQTCSLTIRYEVPLLQSCCTPPSSVPLSFPVGVCRETNSVDQCLALNGRISPFGCSAQSCLPDEDSLRVFRVSVTEGALLLKEIPSTGGMRPVLDGPLVGDFEIYTPVGTIVYLLEGSPPPIRWSISTTEGGTYEGDENSLPAGLG